MSGIDLKFVKGQNLTDLENEINRALDKGWELHGRPMVHAFKMKDDPKYQLERMVVQAMTRPKDVRFNRVKDNQIQRLQAALEASNALINELDAGASEEGLQQAREIQRDANLVFPGL